MGTAIDIDGGCTWVITEAHGAALVGDASQRDAPPPSASSTRSVL
jgi:hypothetical protein